MHLIKKFDQNLLNLAWSLWTELGVAGNKQSHQDVLILIEELIIFTSVLAEIDPRLRDESLDWCAQYNHFISISRLKSLMKDFELTMEPFSKYASSLNNITGTNLPIFMGTPPLKIHLSHKSILRPYASSALLNIRARSIFGTGARADLVTFFLVHLNIDFSIAEVAETGYSKRNLSEVLDDLHFGNLFDRFMQGNQQRYRLKKNSPLVEMLKPIPKYVPWHLIFKILLELRACIHDTDNSADSTKVVALRNCMKEHEMSLQKLGLNPPPFENNFALYLENFSQWVLNWTDLLAKGKKNI